MRTNARKFSAVMRDLAKVPAQASKAIARDIATQIQRDMSAGQDPYGKAWQKRRDGSTSHLKDTGAGRASIRVTPTVGAGFRITVGVLYMLYHQFGGKSHLRGHRKNPNFGRDKDRGGKRGKPPKRSFLPFEVMPRSWGEIITAHITELAQKRINRG